MDRSPTTPSLPCLCQAVSALLVMALAAAEAPAQMAGTPGPFQPREPTAIVGRGEDALSIAGKIKGDAAPPDQQTWRITKGRDYDKLPPEFQWDTAPTPVSTPYPVYPYELLRDKVAGKVRAYFIVGPNGRVIKAELDEDPRPEFGLAVRAMLDSCRFNPAKKKDGSPAYAQVGIEYNFQPKGRSDAPVAPEGRLILRDLEKAPGNIPTLGELDQPLKPLSRSPPAYPAALQPAMPEGGAEVEFFVDANGRVQLPHVKTATAPEFGYAAVQAVAAWRFEPPTKGGKTVVVRAAVPIDFAGRPATAAAKP